MHTFDFKKRTAVVTGGAQGFGLDVAKRFLESGAKVFIWDNDEKLLKSAVDEVKNPNLFFSVVDISNYQDVEKNVADITSKSNIDILINNAGVTGPTGPLWEYDVDMWNKIVQINLTGTFNCCRAIVPNMIKNNYGRIVNVASVAGKDGNANASAYSSGKAGAIGLTKALGKELADNNIAVNAFLEKKISFLQILNIVEKIVIDHRPIKTYNLNQITTIYQQAEELTLNLCI